MCVRPDLSNQDDLEVHVVRVRSGSKLPFRGAFGSRPLSGGKPKQILMIADSWAPTSAIGGIAVVADGFSVGLLLAIRRERQDKLAKDRR
jgi:hypothetical protein